MRDELRVSQRSGSGLLEVLDRVLDKGLIVAGDIQVMLADIELLTIRIRLIVCSLDKAEQLGIDWWRTATFLSSGRQRKKGSAKRANARLEPARSSRERSARHGVVRAASGHVRSRRARPRSDQ